MGIEQNFPIGRRRDSRLRVEVPAILLLLGGPVKVGLRDISQSGAQLNVDEPLALGAEGVLSWLDFEAFGEVVWSIGNHAGITFDELLAPAILLATRDQFDQGRIKSEEQIARERAREWYAGLRK